MFTRSIGVDNLTFDPSLKSAHGWHRGVRVTQIKIVSKAVCTFEPLSSGVQKLKIRRYVKSVIRGPKATLPTLATPTLPFLASNKPISSWNLHKPSQYKVYEGAT